MKPEELFIGAIVSFEKRPCTVEHIERGIVCIKDIQTKTSHWITLTTDDIRPIPLTPKILVKIGFKECQYWHELICGDAIIQVQISHIRMRNGERKFESDLICSIHELQAALRLCGIEKEVVL